MINIAHHRRFSHERAQLLAISSLFLLVPIDNFNAILQTYIGGSPLIAQAAKMLILSLCISGMTADRRVVSLSIIFVVAGWTIIHGLFSPMSNLRWVIQDFGFGIKWIQFPILFLFVDQVAHSHHKLIKRQLIFSYLLVALNLVLSLFGIGKSQYGDGVGALGFFIAGNEVSAMQLVLTSAVLAFAMNRSLGTFFLVALVSIVFGALKGTKTGIFGVLAISLLTPLVMGNAIRGRISIIKTAIFGIIGAAFLPIAIFSISYIVQKLGIIQRFQYFMDRNGVIGALFSDRQNRLLPFFQEYSDQWAIPAKLFGIGIPDADLYGYIELDFLDVLSSEGLVGAALIISIWVGFAFYLARISFKGSKMASQALTLMLFLILISNLSGHIMYSGLAMPFLGIYLGIIRSQAASNS